MGRIKRYWNKKGPQPPSWADERNELLLKIAKLEARVKTRDAELIKEYQRRQRQQAKTNEVHYRLKKAAASGELVRQEAVDQFARIYAEMMASATDNRVCEALIEIGPHTITDARIGGGTDERTQAPTLYVSLPALTLRIRVDERLYGANNKKMPEAEVRALMRAVREPLGYHSRLFFDEEAAPPAGLSVVKGGKP